MAGNEATPPNHPDSTTRTPPARQGQPTQHVPFEAGWPQLMQHRPDPNRVTGPAQPGAVQPGSVTRSFAQTPPPATAGNPQVGGPVPADRGTAMTRPPSPAVAGSKDTKSEPSYYDVSILKAPLWRWEIAWYFYLGGLSAGAYTIGRLAERHGGGKFREISRAAAYLSLLSFLPCPPLLIHDLGDPKRFHHMLRVFKPTSPMNFGTWGILGYSGMATAEAFRQWMLDRYPPEQRGEALRLLNRFIELLHDAAGIPFALIVTGYTGVLLSCTANPLWSKNKWLGPLFSASAVATGAAATSLALSLTAKDGGTPASHRALEKVDTAAHAVEAACLAGFMKEAGPKADTLRHGKMRKWHVATIAGLVLSELLKLLPLPRRLRRLAGGLSALASLAGGFALRWGIVHGGPEAANDPHTARLASRPQGKQIW